MRSWLAAHRVGLLLLAGGVLAAAIFHQPLLRWFGGAGGEVAHDHPPRPGAPAPASAVELPAEALGAMEDALAAYEEVRAGLAADNLAASVGPANALAEALHRARTSMPPELGDAVGGAGEAAQELAQSSSLSEARAAFGGLSEGILVVARADRRLLEGRHAFQCPMTEGFGQWLQPSPQLQNPYMGRQMLTCGSEIEVASTTAPAPVEAGDVAHYTCPMHTWVKEAEPGTCPVCAMDLTPVTTEEVKEGVIRIDHDRRQLIGVKLARVEERRMIRRVTGVGAVKFDESRLTDVTLKFGGFIETLAVDEPGQRVKRGQTLFTLYSPELYAAQQDYLSAVSQRDAAVDDGARKRAEALVAGARRRLELWDIGPGVIDRIASSGQPLRAVPIAARASGFVIEKNVVGGGAVEPGQRLYRLAALETVWIEAEIYEQDVPLVEVGQSADVTISHLPGRRFQGKVSLIYPYLDGMQRTARARIELDNPELLLKPDMFAQIDIRVDLGQRLAVPEPAIIYSGPRRIVFVDIGADRLEPRVVELGVKSDGYYQVEKGLSAGDEVVVSGNFLITSESRLKSATGLW